MNSFWTSWSLFIGVQSKGTLVKNTKVFTLLPHNEAQYVFVFPTVISFAKIDLTFNKYLIFLSEKVLSQGMVAIGSAVFLQ